MRAPRNAGIAAIDPLRRACRLWRALSHEIDGWICNSQRQVLADTGRLSLSRLVDLTDISCIERAAQRYKGTTRTMAIRALFSRTRARDADLPENTKAEST